MCSRCGKAPATTVNVDGEPVCDECKLPSLPGALQPRWARTPGRSWRKGATTMDKDSDISRKVKVLVFTILVVAVILTHLVIKGFHV